MQARLGIVHVEVDSFHAGSHAGFAGRRIDRSEWIAAYQAAYTQVEAALDAGMSVVFDAVSYRRTQRARIERIADKHRVPMTIVYLDVDPDEAKRRLVANRTTPTRVNVQDADFEDVAAGMQQPGDDERVVGYRPDEPLDSWIDRVIKPLLEEKQP